MKIRLLPWQAQENFIKRGTAMQDDYENKNNDHAFLDFGPEPVDKELYDELVTKELESAREIEKSSKERKHSGGRREKPGKKTGKGIGILKKIGLAAGVLMSGLIVYAGASAYIANYDGNSTALNYIKYGGYAKQSAYYNTFEAFDDIEIDVTNCAVVIDDSYDEDFHISYQLLTHIDDDVRCEVVQRDGKSVLVLNADSRERDRPVWDFLKISDEYEQGQYLYIMVPKRDYGSFRINTSGEYASIYDIEGHISGIEVEADDCYGNIGIYHLDVDNVSIKGDNSMANMSDCTVGSAYINIDNGDISIYTSDFKELLDMDCTNSYISLGDVAVGDGGSMRVSNTNQEIYLSLAGDKQAYHITADSNRKKIYCPYYEIYDRDSFEAGDGDRQVELHNKNESIYVFFEADY